MGPDLSGFICWTRSGPSRETTSAWLSQVQVSAGELRLASSSYEMRWGRRVRKVEPVAEQFVVAAEVAHEDHKVRVDAQ